MDQKFSEIYEAFTQCEFQTCLRLIEALDKKQDKAKIKLTEQKKNIILVIKIVSFNKLGRYAQSIQIVNSIQKPSVIPQDLLKVYLNSLRELDLRKKQNEVISYLESQKQKNYVKEKKGYLLLESYLSAQKLQQSSKFALKIYELTKENNYFFAHIYLQYLESLRKNNLMLKKRQKNIIFKPNLPLQFVQLFWTKFTNLFPVDNIIQKNKQFGKEVIQFNIRFLISQGKYKDARTVLEKYRNHLLTLKIINFSKSIYLNEKTQQNLIHLLDDYAILFRSNMDLQKYEALYQLYNDYLELLKNNNIVHLSNDNINDYLQNEQRFQKDIPLPLRFQNYFLSLKSEYKNKIQQKNTKVQYYKTCLKTLLLQIIKIYSLVKVQNQSSNYYLNEFVSHFGKTFTFSQQFILIRDKPHQLKLSQSYNKEDRLIFQINTIKLSYFWNQNPLPLNQQQLFHVYKKYTLLYSKALNQVDQHRVLQKGERYIADEIVVILSDIFRQYIETKDYTYQIIINIVLFLEECQKKSPYNFAIKLRLIYYYELLGYSGKILRIFETLDIKSVQFETLGYLVYKSILLQGLWNEYQGLIQKATRSYQQNLRQIKQYQYKALEKGSFSLIEQFISYDDYLNRSYSKCILNFILQNKFRNTSNQLYLIKKNLDTLSNPNFKLTLNADHKRYCSSINLERQFSSFYGIYNSKKILFNEINIRFEQLNLMAEAYEPNKYQLLKPEYNDIWNFSDFQGITEAYQYKMTGSNTEKQIAFSFKIYQLNIQFQHTINQIVKAVLQKQEFDFQNAFKKIDQNLVSFQQANSHPKEYLYLLRKFADTIQLLNFVIQSQSKKKKKLKQDDKKILQLLRGLQENIYKFVSGYNKKNEMEVKIWNEEYKQNLKQLLINEQRLHNLPKMNVKQYEKVYKIS